MKSLWKEITKDSEPGEFATGFKLGTIFLEDLSITFSELGDIFPRGRSKIIHSVGVIAQGKWTITNNKYTGILGKGCENLLIRLSCAKKVDFTKKTAQEALDNLIPGMSLKCLRNGKPSGNLVAMHSTGGQTSWNFFKHDWSNLIPFPPLEHVKHGEGALAGKFSNFSPYIGNVGLMDLAQFGDDGVAVKTEYPFQLIFKPNPAYRKRYGDDFEGIYMDQLKELPVGHLHDIYAIDKPGCPEVKIGTLETTSKFVSSKFNDEKLFFRHNRAEFDTITHEDWNDYKDKVSWGVLSGVKVDRALPFPKGVSGCPVLRILKKLKKKLF